VASIERDWRRVLRWLGSGERIGDANLILGRLERIQWWQAVSTDFAAMAASASRAWCVLGEHKRLACGTGAMAWRAWLAEGTKGISPCHGTAQIIRTKVQKTITRAIRFPYLSPYNSGSPMKSRGISNQPTYKPRS
jgi:hypothetical protein